jgi:hypothetical protein
LFKIEENLESILTDLTILDRLSNPEKVFATKLNTLNSNYYEDAVLSNLHQELRDYIESSDDLLKNAQPQLDNFVFCKPIVEIAGIEVAAGTVATLNAGQITLVSYKMIQEYVLRGEVILL